MRRLPREELLRLWEVGEAQHPIDRALSLIGAAFPEFSWEQLINLSIGQRDDLLLALRQSFFGPKLSTYAQCPNCREGLEFTLHAPDLRQSRPADPGTREWILEVEEVTVRYRLPNSLDLAAIVHSANIAEARELLLQRCVLEARQNEAVLPVSDLPEAVITALAANMESCDPQAEIQLDLVCPACQHPWLVIFDILSYLWTEISVQSKHLLQAVHVLARYYGWSETEIMAMSNRRRQLYLEMAS